MFFFLKMQFLDSIHPSIHSFVHFLQLIQFIVFWPEPFPAVTWTVTVTYNLPVCHRASLVQYFDNLDCWSQLCYTEIELQKFWYCSYLHMVELWMVKPWIQKIHTFKKVNLPRQRWDDFSLYGNSPPSCHFHRQVHSESFSFIQLNAFFFCWLSEDGDDGVTCFWRRAL